MALKLYIALYKLNRSYQRGGGTVLEPYHWAICIPIPEEGNRLNAPASLYQIASIDGSDDEWVTKHISDAVLIRSSSFLALVQLPDFTASLNQIIRFLNSETPSQDGFYVKPPGVWNCAQWVIRCLQRFQEKSWFASPPPGNLNDQDSYYNFITVDKANRYAMAIQQDVSFEEYVGKLVDNVRVLDGYSNSGTPVGDLRLRVLQGLMSFK